MVDVIADLDEKARKYYYYKDLEDGSEEEEEKAFRSILTVVFQKYAEESISEEQVNRVVQPVLVMIDAGEFVGFSKPSSDSGNLRMWKS